MQSNIVQFILTTYTYPQDGLIPDNDQYHSYQTFTHNDGSFTAIPYDYWYNTQNHPRNLLTDLWITYAGSSRIEREGNFWGINSGPIVDNDIHLLKRNSDKLISNLTITSGNTSSFQSFNTLTAKDVTIDANASSDFVARNEINILNEFDARNGSDVLIHLDNLFPDCNDYTSYLRLRNNFVSELESDNTSTFGSKEIIINFLNKDFFSVNPNPNNGIFDICFNTASKANHTINVSNVFGNLIFSENFYNKPLQLNLSNLSKGVYFISIDGEIKRYIKKIIIQ